MRVVEYHEPGQDGIPIGLFIYDLSEDEVLWRFVDDLRHIVDEFDRIYLQEFVAHLASFAFKHDGVEVFRILDESLSGVLRIGFEATMESADPERELENLFVKHVSQGRPYESASGSVGGSIIC